MGLGNYAGGWGAVESDDYDDARGNGSDGSSGGGISREERLYRFRFSVPEPNPKPGKDGRIRKPNLVNPGNPATKRVLFLTGDPYTIYEHGSYKVPNFYDVMGEWTAACLKRNNLSEECPLCKDKMWPYFIGFFSVIDMGQIERIDGKIKLHHESWQDKDGNVHYRRFQNCLLGAKKGSQDKPGVLRTLLYEVKILVDEGKLDEISLAGTVWDTTRMGSKSAGVGDSWRFVKRLERDEMEDYLVKFGAEKDEIDLSIPVLDIEEPGTALYVDPNSHYNKLKRLVGGDMGGGWSNQSGGDRGQSQVSGAGFGPDGTGDDSDIPF